MAEKRFLILFVSLLTVFSLTAGCVSRPKPYEDSRRRQILDSRVEAQYGRDNPSYIQQLVSTSLLTQAEAARTRLGEAALPGLRALSATDFLRANSVWLEMNPMQAAWQGGDPFFSALARSGYAEGLASLGFDGLFLTAVSESGTTWNMAAKTYQAGRDLISMEIAERYGDETSYADFRQNSSGLLYGGELTPAATGLGPDFSMALRGYPDYADLYKAVTVPEDAWALLPLRRYSDGAMGRILSQDQLAELGQAGVLDPAYAQDLVAEGKGGWAATTEIVGQDNLVRRWLYRYYDNVERPVLDWDDPSGLTRAMLAGNIDWQTEIMGHSLISLNTEAWRGLEPQAPGQPLSAQPALAALSDLSAQIHARGGLVLLQDEYAPQDLAQVQAAGADFVRDTVLSPALEYAMLTTDTEPLKRSIDQSIASGLDQKFLWRATPNGDGLSFDPAGLSTDEALGILYMNEKVRPDWIPYLKAADNRLYASSAGLAAVMSGFTPREALLLEPDAVEVIQAAQLLQIAFRAFQPGLLMLSARDLEGTMFADSQGPSALLPSQTAWSLDGNRLTESWAGLTADVGIYAPITRQIGRAGTFAEDLRKILDIRDSTQVSLGQVVARANITAPEAVGVLVRLPGGDLLLVAGNFSPRAFVTRISFRSGLVPAGTTATDLWADKRLTMDQDSVALRFEPWQFRVIRMRSY